MQNIVIPNIAAILQVNVQTNTIARIIFSFYGINGELDRVLVLYPRFFSLEFRERVYFELTSKYWFLKFLQF